MPTIFALVDQRQSQPPQKQPSAGSNPAERTKNFTFRCSSRREALQLQIWILSYLRSKVLREKGEETALFDCSRPDSDTLS